MSFVKSNSTSASVGFLSLSAILFTSLAVTLVHAEDPEVQARSTDVPLPSFAGSGLRFGRTDLARAPLESDGDATRACCPEAASAAPAPLDIQKNRYISFLPNNDGIAVAFEVKSGSDLSGWVGPPVLMTDLTGDTIWVADVVEFEGLRVWDQEVVHVKGCVIAPGTDYTIRALADEGNWSEPIDLSTVPQPTIGNGTHGDCVGVFDANTQMWTPPNGVVNFLDLMAVLSRFQGRPTAPHISVVDVAPQWPNQLINLIDIVFVVEGFRGSGYPHLSWTYQTLADCPLGPDPD